MARHIYSAAVLLILAFSLSGCASTINNQMQSWVGHHQSELILSWGPPHQTASDGKGGTVLIYRYWVDLGQKPGRAYRTASGAEYTAPERNGWNQVRMFYVNPDGIIYSWRWQGL